MKIFEEENNHHTIRNVIMPSYEAGQSKCWSVEFYKSNGKKNARWILKTSDGSLPEYSVKISKLCDVKDVSQWSKFTSFEFALELLNNFRKGHEEFTKWISFINHERE